MGLENEMRFNRITESAGDDVWDLLAEVSEKFTNMNLNDFLNYIDTPTRNTFDEESPMFILPNGSIVSVGDALDANEDILPFDTENIHASLLKCFAVKYAYDEGYTGTVVDQLEEYDYDVNDIFVDMLNELTYSDGWIRINCGQTWEEERFYAVLPNSMTSSQYNTLENWLEFGIDLGKKSVMIYATDKDDFYEYPLDKDLFPEDIIKRIKRYYSSGKFYEKLSLREFLNEEYEQRDGVTYSNYSTGVIGDQVNFVIVAEKDDKVIGYLQYGYYRDTPHIQMIKVADEYRRQGIGTKMMQYLQKLYPDAEINPGMTTPDGTLFLKDMFVEVPDEARTKLYKKRKRWLNAYYRAQAEMKPIEKELDRFYETPDEEITDEYRDKIQKVGEKWQELYDRMRELDRKLYDFDNEYGPITHGNIRKVKGEF